MALYLLGLNTFFIRYGCRTEAYYLVALTAKSQYLLHQVWVSDFWASQVLTWFALSQYLLHQVWVSDPLTPRFSRRLQVSIPSSSGMGVGPGRSPHCARGGCLNTFFIRYGCRTIREDEREENPCLNTFFIRYGCRTCLQVANERRWGSQYLLHQVWVSDHLHESKTGSKSVSIPSSSGMGVGPYVEQLLNV